MARKKRNTRKRPKEDSAELPVHLVLHLRRLGLNSIEEYAAWCTEQGIKPSLNRSQLALEGEYTRAVRKAADAKITSSRRHDDPVQAFESALEGSLDLESVGRAELRLACQALSEMQPECPQLMSFLRFVDERGRFLLESETIGGLRLPFIRGLVSLNARRGQWLRPVEDWRPRSRNRRKQFGSLARHLMSEYPVPVFMDSAWLRNDRSSYSLRDLFVHIGRGGNPRKAKLSVPLTKREAHEFMLAPDHYSIEGALRWGQIHALGGRPLIADAVVATQLGSSFEHEEFWSSVLRFFVANPMLDHAQIGPLIDYIEHSKYSSIEVVLPDGSLADRPPPQPGFSMAGRTPESLLKQMERWHEMLGRGSSRGPESWSASGVGPFSWETGRENKRTWSLTELRSLKALRFEGQAMRNCVASYAQSCAAGRCSIWSLELTTKDGVERRQTVEVSRQGVIVQSRGKLNCPAPQRDLEVLRRWATQEDLTISSYL